jgi:hypothetical protein
MLLPILLLLLLPYYYYHHQQHCCYYYYYYITTTTFTNTTSTTKYCYWTEGVGVKIKLLRPNQEGLGSILCRDTGYPLWGSSDVCSNTRAVPQLGPYIFFPNLSPYYLAMNSLAASGIVKYLNIIIIIIRQTYILYILTSNLLSDIIISWPPLWSSGKSSWLQIRRPGFDSRHYQKKKVVGLERGPLSVVSTTEELLDRKVEAPV